MLLPGLSLIVRPVHHANPDFRRVAMPFDLVPLTSPTAVGADVQVLQVRVDAPHLTLDFFPAVQAVPVTGQQQPATGELDHRAEHRADIGIVGDQRRFRPGFSFIGGRREVTRLVRIAAVNCERAGLQADRPQSSKGTAQRLVVAPGAAAIGRKLIRLAVDMHQGAVGALDHTPPVVEHIDQLDNTGRYRLERDRCRRIFGNGSWDIADRDGHEQRERLAQDAVYSHRVVLRLRKITCGDLRAAKH